MERVTRLALILVIVLSSAQAVAETIEEALPSPAGYSRVEANSWDFTNYLRQLELLPETELVRLWDGSPMTNWPRDVRVIDLPFYFDADLEQCADVGYRLYADYLRSIEADSLLEFPLQNGQSIVWENWKGGKRLRYSPVSDRHVEADAPADSSPDAFRDFLHYLFQWSGSAAMKAYLEPVSEDQLQPGDMIVQNTTGGIGHASIIIDKARNENGDALYLIANGWTPAQTPFIWKAGEENGSGYWFTLDGYRRHMQPFNFGPFEFRNFRRSAESRVN